MADQDVTGQVSLICQTMVPPQTGDWPRKCSIPNRTARAWLSEVAQCQSSKVLGTGRCAASPRVSFLSPSSAFWCASMPGESWLSGSSWIHRVKVAHDGGPWKPNSDTNRGAYVA